MDHGHQDMDDNSVCSLLLSFSHVFGICKMYFGIYNLNNYDLLKRRFSESAIIKAFLRVYVLLLNYLNHVKYINYSQFPLLFFS